MKAAVFRGAGKPLSLETLDEPKPGPGDLVIKVHRCGICGTDLHMTSGHQWDFPVGTVLGHEYAGEVVEIGGEVEGFKKGDLVTGMPSAGCGHCAACATGNQVLCHHVTMTTGGYAEYMRLPAKVGIRLPRTFSAADGALVEPFAVSLHGLNVASIKPGDRVLVLGGGTVALTTIFWAKRLGASRVVAVSRSTRRAQMAIDYGADAFVRMDDNDVPEVIEKLGGSPDIVFECIGAVGMLAKAVQHVAQFGQIVSMGFCLSPDPILPGMAAMKAVRMSFPVGYTLRDFEYVADMMCAGAIDPKMMITSVIPLGDMPKIFDELRGPNAETKVHVSMAGA